MFMYKTVEINYSLKKIYLVMLAKDIFKIINLIFIYPISYRVININMK